MRNNSINGAKTDYKGEGPNLLSGYDPYEKIRNKLLKSNPSIIKGVS